MPDATLEAIPAAIESALASLAPSTFKRVDHWAGDLSVANAVENLAALVGNQHPAALVAFDGEAGANDVETTGWQADTRGRSTWAVIVVTGSTQPARRAQAGQASVKGVYQLVDPVLGALNNLVVSGLQGTDRLRYLGTRWFASKRGHFYALIVRFTADRVVAKAAAADDSVALTEIIADENLAGTADTPPDPLEQVRVVF